ncbi:helix-turn-helix transcriptional regulator [Serratia sp. M24T3]|uniref:helix-turn-helix domain-containing protein n=1 Tax=Serratia sp. M24T3 TaxID=932213 RepID=UPI00025BB64F|nr:helix-turn-helix transcriptional regulator [Serratia sp. M24T3]EIC83340.1 hypothetical protein SPM24T3_17055 [Serratia sp. M24T3]
MQTPLRKLRVAQNLTIQDVANSLNIDVGNLSRIERGKQITSLAIAEKLSKFFGGRITEMQILYPQRFMTSADFKETEKAK